MKRKTIIVVALWILVLGAFAWAHFQAQACRKNRISDESCNQSLAVLLDGYLSRHQKFPVEWKSIPNFTTAVIKELSEDNSRAFRTYLDEVRFHNQLGPNPGPGDETFPNIRLLLYPYPNQGNGYVAPYPRFWIVYKCGRDIQICEDLDSTMPIWTTPANLIEVLKGCEHQAKADSDTELTSNVEAQIKYLQQFTAQN